MRLDFAKYLKCWRRQIAQQPPALHNFVYVAPYSLSRSSPEVECLIWRHILVCLTTTYFICEQVVTLTRCIVCAPCPVLHIERSMTCAGIRNRNTIATRACVNYVVRVLWKLRKRQCYGLMQKQMRLSRSKPVI